MRTAVLIVVLALLALFTWLNRHALMFPHTLDLGFVKYTQAPLGLILLLTGLVLTLLFYFWAGIANLRAQADTARLLRDIEGLRTSLDSAEGSRFAQLQSHLDSRLNALGSGEAKDGELAALSARMDALQRDLNLQFDQLDDYLKRKLG